VTNIVLARDPGASDASEEAHRTPPGSSALRESEASAANVLSVRKRSVSGKCFICAKAKRQQQMFSVAKAKRQLQSAQSERKSTSRYGDAPKRRNDIQ